MNPTLHSSLSHYDFFLNSCRFKVSRWARLNLCFFFYLCVIISSSSPVFIYTGNSELLLLISCTPSLCCFPFPSLQQGLQVRQQWIQERYHSISSSFFCFVIHLLFLIIIFFVWEKLVSFKWMKQTAENHVPSTCLTKISQQWLKEPHQRTSICCLCFVLLWIFWLILFPPTLSLSVCFSHSL